jgi:zinc finger MYND domain-containing protein 10
MSHSWDAAGRGRTQITDVDETQQLYAGLPTVLDPSEAERYVESLRVFDIEEVGTSDYFQQHQKLEKLNVQAHQSAMTNSDEYILESMLTFEKLDVLIHDLIVIEAWKENLYPELLDRLAGRNTMRTYFILYHEATILNFLEIVVYHKHVVAALGERAMDLVDYCARKLVRLNGGYDFRSIEPASGVNDDTGEKKSAKEIAAELESRTPQDELAQHLTEIEFKCCIAAVSVCRMLCEHADSLPLSVVSRMTDTHDLLVLLIPLIENPPWTRRLPDTGKWQKLIDQKWADVAPIDLLKITKLEGQPWLGIYHLIAKDIFRERYHLNSFRKGQVLRVRKFLNDILLDQLPFLADIQRYMDELQIMEVPDASNTGSVFMLQQVSVSREKVVKGRNWKEAADRVFETVFTMTDKDDKDLRRMADLYADDDVGQVIEPGALDDRAGLGANPDIQELLKNAQND